MPICGCTPAHCRLSRPLGTDLIVVASLSTDRVSSSIARFRRSRIIMVSRSGSFTSYSRLTTRLSQPAISVVPRSIGIFAIYCPPPRLLHYAGGIHLEYRSPAVGSAPPSAAIQNALRVSEQTRCWICPVRSPSEVVKHGECGGVIGGSHSQIGCPSARPYSEGSVTDSLHVNLHL